MPDVGFRAGNVETYKAAAARRGLRLSDWAREACDTALKAEGFSAGSPEQQYALVAGGELVKGPRGGEVITFRPHPISEARLGFPVREDTAWFPIENRFPQDYDAAKHWIAAPLPLSIDAAAGVVVRFYPIAGLKTLERA